MLRPPTALPGGSQGELGVEIAAVDYGLVQPGGEPVVFEVQVMFAARPEFDGTRKRYVETLWGYLTGDGLAG